jgi:hypothetical protein
LALAKTIGVLSATVGAIALTIGLTLVRWKSWSPVKAALTLKAGNHIEVPFRAEFSARHYIYLTVKQGEDWKHTKCLLGAEIYAEFCRDVPSVVDVSWTVFSEGSLIDRGDSTKWLGTSGVTGRLIGVFDAKKGTPYAFSISVNRDGIALNALNPKVTVEVDNRILEQYIIEAAILQWVGGIVATLGLIAVSWVLWATAVNKTA